jgi:hypothetical protein
MKPEERIASEFLKKHFGRTPAYEPLGQSIPPDFSMDGTAFEVRRLNQRFLREDGTNEGLEQIDSLCSKVLRAASLTPNFETHFQRGKMAESVQSGD